MVRRLAAALILFVAMLASSSAHAARRRVVLVNADAQLLRAVVVTLTAWDIDVVSHQATAPGATLPDAQRRADELAHEVHADALAWISVGKDEAVLWIYDTDTKQIGSRVLSDRPPFDDASAAAVALSLKTLLRSSIVAPEPERFGATPFVRATPTWLRVEAVGGARLLPRDTSELRGGFGLSLWPRAFDELFGFGLALSVGPGARVDSLKFSGRYSDLALSPSIRSTAHFGEHVVLEPALGASLHLTSIDGTAVDESLPVRANRADVSLDSAVVLDVRFGVVSVGFRAGLGYMVRYQRYTVDGQPALATLPLLGDIGLRFSVGML